MREVRSIDMTRPLTWSEAIELEIDFCVWVLLRDGLRVPPFDSHREGSGELRAAGLTAPDWRDWLERVVVAQGTLSQRVRTVGDLSRLAPGDATNLARHLDRARPPNVWNGAETVGERLRSLWLEYEPEGEAWRRQVIDAGGPVDLSPPERGRLWEAIDVERTAGRTLATYLVRYATPVVDALSPDVLVVSLGGEHTAHVYLRLLRQGIARLESLPKPGG